MFALAVTADRILVFNMQGHVLSWLARLKVFIKHFTVFVVPDTNRLIDLVVLQIQRRPIVWLFLIRGGGR